VEAESKVCSCDVQVIVMHDVLFSVHSWWKAIEEENNKAAADSAAASTKAEDWWVFSYWFIFDVFI
jgi:hypothetical protein